MVYVNICSPDLDIADQWDALAKRAPANVFMNPAALRAAQETKFAKIHVLQAWDGETEAKKLVGIWALQEVNFVPFWPAVLAAPPYNYAFVASPVIDPAFVEQVVPAFLEAIEKSPALPNVIRLKFLDGESSECGAMLRTLTARHSQTLTLSETTRPFVSKEFGLKNSGSTRKKLRQDWNRLSALGAVDIVNDKSPDTVREAFEVFLTMEADSWKGEQGTALLCDEDDALFVRRMIANLASQQNASVALLRVDGKPIAAQVLLYSGNMAYTWKTAFSSEFSKYSPGALLIDKLTEQLFATDGIDAIESCSPEGSFMAQLWAGRRTTLDLLVDVGARKSLNFTVAALGERAYAQLRIWRNKLRTVSWLPHPKKRGLAAR